MDEIRFKGLNRPFSEMALEAKGKELEPKGGDSFLDILKDSLDEVNDLQNQADEAIRELARGSTKDLHRTMVMIEKAELSFKLMMQVRNKLLDAYHEIMRLQV